LVDGDGCFSDSARWSWAASTGVATKSIAASTPPIIVICFCMDASCCGRRNAPIRSVVSPTLRFEVDFEAGAAVYCK
jgi:hypothetical protein